MGIPQLGWKVWLAIGIGVVVVVAIAAFPALSRISGRNAVETELQELRDRLAAISVVGGDMNEADALRARIRVLTNTANRYGASLDLGAITLSGCDAMQTRIESEWNNYISTDYSDPLKRNNTRASILAFGATLSRCYEQAIVDASTPEGLDQISASLLNSIARSEARRVCFEADQAGCGRSGVSEPHGFDKAAHERDQIQAPLRAAYALVRSKIAAPRNAGLNILNQLPAPESV